MPVEENNVNPRPKLRDELAFWILGLCNNFAYVVMLSAAEDILSVSKSEFKGSKNTDKCLVWTSKYFFQPFTDHRYCTQISTGAVLLANIIPSWIIKMLAPFFLNRLAFSIRHWIIVSLQTASFVIVANCNSVNVGLVGVVVASLSSGFGEVTYFSLASYFPNYVVAAWSSGTGAAGISGAIFYAAFTDSNILGLSPKSTLLCMLGVPVLFFSSYDIFTLYHYLLLLPRTVHRVQLTLPSSYLIPVEGDGVDASRTLRRSFTQKMKIGKSLWKFMIPLSTVYFGEYFINQGLVVFDCNSSFNMSPERQYRWYQVLYQIGVFISRSSSQYISLKSTLIPFLSILQVNKNFPFVTMVLNSLHFQLINTGLFFWNAVSQFTPHIIIIFAIVFYEGLLGGAAYVNTFTAIHKTVNQSDKEFSLAFAAMSDSFGIVLSAFLAIPTHNYICKLPL
uniref:Battenin n=1 Tax=Syphacia muris TaxID=451379 RepID=A0A0N5AMN0_9BILA